MEIKVNLNITGTITIPDPNPWDPSQATRINNFNSLFWYKAGEGHFGDSAKTTIAGDDLDPVGAWHDQQFNLDATQSNADLKPRLRLDTLNGLPAVETVDDVDFLDAGNPGNYTGPFTLFFVGNFPGPPLTRTIMDGIGGFKLLANPRQVDAGGEILHYGVPDTGFHILTLQINGDTSFVRIDGLLAGAGTLANPSDWRTFSLFRNVAGVDGYRAKAIEIFGYTGVLSLEEIEDAEWYLSDRSALPLI